MQQNQIKGLTPSFSLLQFPLSLDKQTTADAEARNVLLMLENLNLRGEQT